MKYEVYTKIEVTDDFNVFDFISSGKHGDVLKRVAFTKTDQNKIYNLSLGDVAEDNEMNDYVVTDNGDRNKVLATVASIVDAYTKRFPDRWILFKGSTAERTRLYRMAEGLHLAEFSDIYDLWGYVEEDLLPFTKNLKVNAFLLKRKY